MKLGCKGEAKKGDKMRGSIAGKLFIFFVSIYLLTASDYYYLTDVSQSRIETAESIIERSDLTVLEGVGIRGDDGRYYPLFGIGSALLAIPFYVVGKLMGGPPENAVHVMNQLIGAATAVVVFLFSLSLGYSRRASLSVAIFYGLGTAAWFLAKDQGDHAMEIFFVLLSVYSMYRYLRYDNRLYLLASALSIGVGFITRYTSLLALPPIFLMILLWRRRTIPGTAVKMTARDILFFLTGFLPFVCFVLWFNYYRFGSILETGYSLLASRSRLDFFTGTPLLTGLSGFLVSPGKGFFYYSPITLLFFFSLKSFVKNHLDLAVCFVGLMIFYLLFLSKNVFWHGDCTWGPRYLYVITPFLIIPAAELIDSPLWPMRKFTKISVYSLFILSLSIQLAAISVSPDKYFFSLKENGIKFIVADVEGIPPLIEPPSDIYFDWHRSPLPAQFRYVYNAARNMTVYKYTELPEGTPAEKIKASPDMNIFDFWWLHKYFVEGSYSGFIVALVLLFFAVLSAVRLWKSSLR